VNILPNKAFYQFASTLSNPPKLLASILKSIEGEEVPVLLDPEDLSRGYIGLEGPMMIDLENICRIVIRGYFGGCT
jgi:hypothetical protein